MAPWKQPYSHLYPLAAGTALSLRDGFHWNNVSISWGLHIYYLFQSSVALQAQRQSAWGKATGNEGQEGTLCTMGALHEAEFARLGAA